MFLASLRLAVALVCVGASLILGSHWLGFIPDSAPVTMRARQSLSEAIAVNAAAHIRKQQWRDLSATLETLVERNSDLLSVGVRSDLGSLRIDTGHHDETWSAEEMRSGQVTKMSVPITLNRRPWGHVELCYHNPHQTVIARTIHHPLIRMLLFFCCAGVIAVRVMKLFVSTQVVPDRVRQALDTLAEGLLVLDEKGRIIYNIA